MPQLDTIYTLMTFLWTWTTLHLMMQKIKTTMMTMNPTTPPSHNKPPITLPWL
uniref:ATP synthase F0 subunit 8 n=1 Tax=Elaphe taeniura TaxID=74398 RepID=A0A096VPF1_9SAUR|nr:ATP synthase F0 subunit 8 [Elaphe taeniurus]AGS12981.1 ATP synthase F0 subunit 8 [Elaphe taeniurus]